MTQVKVAMSMVCKLASILVHVKEGMSADGHAFDTAALKQLLDDPEVKAWIKEMGPLAPLRRKG